MVAMAPPDKVQTNLSGKRNVHLIALEPLEVKKCGRYWLCLCDCGNFTEVLVNNFPRTKSCGCLRRVGRHGYKKDGKEKPVYSVWAQMKTRCLNKNHRNYKDYGGRGIKICRRWLDFKNFIFDMGHPPTEMTLERKNNNKGYSPDNCKWATQAEQTGNTRVSRRFTLNGETKCLSEWARCFGINERTLHGRIKDGLSFEEAINRPFGRGTFIKFNGQNKNIKTWARHLKLNKTTLQLRLSKGWPLERALQAGDFRK